jgi:iron-sulfur cluster assembly accessory protein
MDAQNVIVTDSAIRKIASILGSEKEPSVLRVSVEGGGCSGFQYKFDIQRTADAEDIVIERDGAKVVIDPVSLQYLSGSRIDYADELIGAAFKIENPNATASCGCGTSFSL